MKENVMAEVKNPVIRMQTSQGEIRVELDAAQAPLTVANFLDYLRDGFYDGTIFHRVIDGFMIQGGGMTADMKEKKTRKPVKNEATNGLSNKRGTIAMARTSVVDSATAQFFINVADNDFLDHRNTTAAGFGYAVFGRVIGGMETVDAIRKVPTGRSGMHDDVPRQPVVIEQMTEEA
jgi:cyclophilin family peptidyl-prolyl cis-trans isomerase